MELYILSIHDDDVMGLEPAIKKDLVVTHTLIVLYLSDKHKRYITFIYICIALLCMQVNIKFTQNTKHLHNPFTVIMFLIRRD